MFGMRKGDGFGVQFVSRVLMPDGSLGILAFPAVRFTTGETLRIEAGLEFRNGPSEFTFAQPWPQRPSIGAYEFVDPYADTRWPGRVLAQFTVPDLDARTKSQEFAYELLGGLRSALEKSFQAIDQLNQPDQFLKVPGYRRIWYTKSLGIDMSGNPVPSDEWWLYPAEVGELIGPGYVRYHHSFSDRENYALVWSQAVSLPARTSLPNDEAAVRKRAHAIKQHWNSHQEIEDAEAYAAKYDTKGAIRSGASAVDAAIRFYADLWGVRFPKGDKRFDEKIEEVLQAAGRPSYQAANPGGARSLVQLYRARNSMHEGDCYYNDPDSGKRVEVEHVEARRLVEEARRFLLWVDSLA